MREQEKNFLKIDRLKWRENLIKKERSPLNKSMEEIEKKVDDDIWKGVIYYINRAILSESK
jgi:hypothetical protein